MPKRSNLFQQVVRVLYEWRDGSSELEESKLLADLDAGTDREVDVVITGTVAGHPMRVGVEASATKRKHGVDWVDAMLSKHEKLTDKLVLVSESGFTIPARKKAEKNNALALAPDDLPDDFGVGQIMNKLGSVRLRAFSLDRLVVIATCRSPTGEKSDFRPPLLVHVFRADGTVDGTLKSVVGAKLEQHLLEVAEKIKLTDAADDLEEDLILHLSGPFEATKDRSAGHEKPDCLQLNINAEEDLGLWPIERITLEGRLRVGMTEVPLSHKRIPELSEGFSYGKGTIGDARVTFVISETPLASQGRLLLMTKEGLEEGELRIF